MRAVFLAALLCGCGVDIEIPGALPHRFNTLCFSFHSLHPIDIERTAVNAALTQETLYRRLGITFCGSVGTVDVVLMDDTFTGADGRDKAGMTIPFANQIFMVQEQYALLHECLHLWDFQHVAIGSAWHENWQRNGYFDAAAEYQFNMSYVRVMAEHE